MQRFLRHFSVFVTVFFLVLSPVFSLVGVRSAQAAKKEAAPTSWVNTAPTIEQEKAVEAQGGAQVFSSGGGGGGASSGQPGTKSEIKTDSKRLPQSDERTGALTYAFPFTIPAGRNGMQPDLALQYNSQDTSESSLVGFGWSLGVPSISRMNKKGFSAMYATPVFQSAMDGELVDLGGGVFGAKVEGGSFLQYTFIDNTWVVKDKRGVTYRFGTSVLSRQDDPADASRVYAWLLDEVRDANGNAVHYAYEKVGGAVYPKTVTYTDQSDKNGVSLVGSGAFRVEFVREARPDVMKSSRTGFTVTTTDRIREVRVLSSGVLVRKFVLGYATGSSGSRSLLASVTETGVHATTGESITLPATTFTYSSSLNTWGVDEIANGTTGEFDFPNVQFSDHYYGRDLGVRMADINGDGWLDAIQSYFVGDIYQQEQGVYLHNGTTWVKEGAGSPWVIPAEMFFVKHYDGSDLGVRVADVNGDGRADLVRSINNNNADPANAIQKVYINTGSGWVFDASWVLPPLYFVDYSGRSLGVRMADVNGDGMTDIVRAIRYQKMLYVNTGSGWVLNEDWNFADAEFIDNTEREIGTELIDVDGDGLVDIFQNYIGSNGPQQILWRNTGRGFVRDTSWTFPDVYFTDYYDASDRGGRMADLNGDGLPELFIMMYSGQDANGGALHDRRIYRNTGTGFVLDTTIAFPVEQYLYNAQTRRDLGARIADINGDGVSDIVASYRLNDYNADGTHQSEEALFKHQVGVSGAGRADVLSTIGLSKGGSVTLTYTPTTFLRESNGAVANGGLPMIMDTVSRVVVDNGFGTTFATSYVYEGGVWYANGAERKFVGFRTVSKTLPDGSVVKTYAHQGNGDDASVGESGDHLDLAGRVFRVDEFAGSAGGVATGLLRKTLRDWQRAGLNGGRGFVSVAEERVQMFDGDQDFREKISTMTYDVVGNVLSKSEESDGGADRRTMTMTYAVGSGSAFVAGAPTSLVSSEVLRDAAGVVVRETRQMYDGLVFGSVLRGNVTRAEQRVASGEDASAFVATQTAYNGNGSVISETDPRGFVTTMTYDSVGIYPASMTNALGHVELYSHDAVTGQQLSKKDSNGKAWSTTLDALGRVKTVRVPDPATGLLVVQSEYFYNDAAGAVSLRSLSYTDAVVAREEVQYIDGLGRVLQQRKEMEVVGGSAQYAVTDYRYDYADRVVRETLPYVGVGLSRSAASGDAALAMTTAYDALGRISSHANVVGVSTTAYDQWVTTVTDALGNVKRMQHDVFGQLVRVDEVYSPTETFVTTYGYDAAGSLVQMRNAIGQTREFGYDMLGRRVRATALHAEGVSTGFGVWTWSYDAAGNVVSSVDPRGVVVASVYDALGRKTSEDAAGSAGVEATFMYDNCTLGRGRLCRETSAGVDVQYTYDAMGNVMRESKAVNGTVFTTTLTYNRGGGLVVVSTPDAAETRYEYNSIGLVELVKIRERGEVPYTTILHSVDYGVTDQAVVERYGATGTHRVESVFDAGAMYRMMRRETIVSTMVGGVLSQVSVQNVAYTYDASGNVTRVVDSSASAGGATGSGVASKTVDYAYDAVGRLVTESVSGVSAAALLLGAGPVSRAWAYDAVGTITSGPAGVGSFGVDAAGSVVSSGLPGAVGSATYVYDYAGRMTSSGVVIAAASGSGPGATPAKVTRSTSTYAASGARVRNEVVVPSLTGGSDVIKTVFSPNEFYSIEGAGSSAKRTKHVMLGGRSVATITGVGTWGAPYAKRYVSAPDHLGSASVMFDLADGVVAEVMDYYAFGRLRVDDRASSAVAAGFDEKRKFVGKEFDKETDLSFLEARYYAGKFGRFMAVDPVFVAMGDAEAVKSMTGSEMMVVLADPQALGAYTYGRNNPMKYVDPDGEWFRQAIMYAFSAPYRNQLAGTAKMIKENPGASLAGAAIGVAVTAAIVSGVAAVGASTAVVAAAGTVTNTVGSKATNSLTIGKNIKNLGTVIENAAGKITGFNHDGSYHGLDRIISRGVSPKTLMDTVKEPIARFSGRFDRVGYLSKDAYVVLDKVGNVVTSWTNKEFGATIKNVLNDIIK